MAGKDVIKHFKLWGGWSGTYRGEVQEEQASGEGEFVGEGPDEGYRYKGHWAAGRQDGRGEMRWKSGMRYNGEWSNGFPNGRGELLLRDGVRRFDGEWCKGRATNGTAVDADGTVYQVILANNAFL
jgi:hypothetical protein